MRALLDGFAAGLNAYLADHPHVKPRLLTRFEPWYPLAFIRYNYFQQGFVWASGVRSKELEVAAREPDLDDNVGSNGWVVGPSRTADGADWTTASLVIQRVTDVTPQATLSFYGNNIGIGTTTPGVKLDVAGEIRGTVVTIFGGIVRCDMTAEGVIGAARDIGIKVPVVLRIEGTNAQRGRELLAKGGLALTAATDLTDAAKKVVAAARGKS